MKLKSHQPPMTIDAQIENLKKLGLLIEDEKDAKDFLNDVSYFRLIKAFSIGLKGEDGLYNKEITFGKIKDLYLFNSNFRQAICVQVEKVEINLRCRISNYFSCKYGVFGYEDVSNFKNAAYHAAFLEDVQDEIKRNSRAPFVKNFQENYDPGKLPFYAAIELFSFGTLSKFYKNMKNEDKKAVAQTYGIGYTYLESWIEHFAFVRNICAHYGRLYNINLSKTPILYREYAEISSMRVFATLICLKHILPNDRHWLDFVDLIEAMFDKYPHVKISAMGFPANWKAILKRRLI